MPAYKDKQRGTRYYGLTENPVRVAGSIGKKKAGVMKFWTVEEFNAVIVNVTSFPARVGLSVLFWTGMRIGELLGLSVSDVNFEAGTISITKSYNKINGKEIITEPKTPKSKRVISALEAPGPYSRLYFHLV